MLSKLARYLRGQGDSIQSHETVPMLMSALLSFVKRTYNCSPISFVTSHNARNVSDLEDEERQKIRITVDEHGHLQRTTQIEHYYYRDDALKNITFFDFVSRFRLEKIRQPLTDAVPRLGTYHRFSLQSGHPLTDTHCIVEAVNIAQGDGLQLRIPRVIGCNIPRPSSEMYQLFMLSHFKPFGVSNPLITTEKSVGCIFSQHIFDTESKTIMANWEAMHECEDERDAERIRKRVHVSKDVDRALQLETALLEDSNLDLTSDLLPIPVLEESLEQNKMLLQLKGCNYFVSTSDSDLHSQNDCPQLPKITPALLGSWKSDTKQQEQQLALKRRQPIDYAHGMPFINNVQQTENAAMLAHLSNEKSTYIPSTESVAYEHVSDITDLLRKICESQDLNVKQSMAFYIIAHAFFRYVDDLKMFDVHAVTENSSHKNYLHLLMTGPGGTGKSYVVKAVEKVMSACGYANAIRFVAPTGNTAVNIQGQTIHKAFSIKFFDNDSKGTSPANTYSIGMNPDQITHLKNEWEHIHVLMIDEVSLLDQELLSQIDHTLRLAKNSDEYFGGIVVIFAGDFFQYPPVGGSPLYKPIGNSVRHNTDGEFK